MMLNRQLSTDGYSKHQAQTWIVRQLWRVTVLICLVLIAVGVTRAEDPSLSHDARALLESSRRAYANDKFNDAVKFAKKATQLEPEASVCQLWLGVAYSEKTQSGWFGSKLLNARRCRKAFERAVKLDSSSLEAREGLIEFHVRAPGIAGGNMETAWAQVEFIMQRDSMRGYLAAAYIHERKEKDTSAAEDALINAVAADTTSVLAQLRLAGFYVRVREHGKAESIFAMAAESGEREALLNLGWLHSSERGASSILRTLLDHNPQDVDALFFLAERYLGQANFNSGDSLIAVFADVSGECSELKYLQAVRALTKTMEPSEAIIGDLRAYLDAEPCIQYDPCWANPHLLANIYSHRPAWARGYYLLSSAYKRIPGMTKDSRKHLERALELDPTFWQARQALEMTGMNF